MDIDEMFRRFERDNPNPCTELYYINNYTLLVAIVLSAQTTDKKVNQITHQLFGVIKTPADLLAFGQDEFKDRIKTIGLYNAKAGNVWKLSNLLIEKYNSNVPENVDSLISLPGVGIKTAHAFLNIACNAPLVAVDTHVFRLTNRIGLAKTTNPMATEKVLSKIIPEKWKNRAHHWLILHGRYICKARKPLCCKCIIRDLCQYKDKTI